MQGQTIQQEQDELLVEEIIYDYFKTKPNEQELKEFFRNKFNVVIDEADGFIDFVLNQFDINQHYKEM